MWYLNKNFLYLPVITIERSVQLRIVTEPCFQQKTCFYETMEL